MLPKKRHSNYLAQKKMFLVVSEGRNSEQEYFGQILGDIVSERVYVKCLPAQNGTSPNKILDRLRGYREAIRATDEMWGVADRDRWTQEQRDKLLAWADASARPYKGVVINSPMFELWLLLHFQDVAAEDSAGSILKALNQWLPDYGKQEGRLLDCAPAFSLKAIRAAVARAKQMCPDGQPRIDRACTNAWVLVERILVAGVPDAPPA